ncbi:hypothetical protein B0H16DRAFT_1507020 [Mycena metata]|uniref:F-box domain-containing protein n=1 Tax=Mycena metata TaxID=1033252 RepID=A0AAD7K429_9AGAR|nr:hypothetical protein B0H16DRAFT_1507020 [Mycena metata]
MPLMDGLFSSTMSLVRRAPIHALPTELVREIVRACCDDGITLPFSVSKPAAIAIGQFCSRWRAVAHSERGLWQEFQVALPDDLTGGQYEALMNFIANGAVSNETRLSLRQGAHRERDFNPMLPVVISHSHCLQSLSLSLPGRSLEQLLSLTPLPLRRLQSLSIAIRVTDGKDVLFLRTMAEGVEPSPADFVSTTFTDTPLLTHLNIGYDWLNPITYDAFPLSALNLPWAQLTHLDGPNVWIEVLLFFSIFERCPNLVSCVITLDAEGAEDAEIDAERMTRGALKKFHVTFLELYSWVWTHLTLPALTDLKIASFRDLDPWEDDIFDEFMVRSGCALTHLTISFGFLNAIDGILHIFDASPDLQELTLSWTRLPDEVDDEEPQDVAPLMAYLHYHPTALHLPSLRKIQIDATPETVNMLVSRCCCADSILLQVVLFAEQPSSCETLFATQIAEMRSAGATVTWETIVFPLKRIYDPDPGFQEDTTPEGSVGTPSEEGSPLQPVSVSVNRKPTVGRT